MGTDGKPSLRPTNSENFRFAFNTLMRKNFFLTLSENTNHYKLKALKGIVRKEMFVPINKGFSDF